MITTEGSLHVKRFLAGSVGSIARSIALGVGTSAESASDTTLNFETVRADVTLVSYDFTTNRLVFKASFPEGFLGTVYEVGLWSLGTNYLASDFGSRDIALFDTSENWTGTFGTTAARVGLDAIQHTPAASVASTSIMNSTTYDFSGYSSMDEFVFAYNIGNTNTSQITFRFLTDASNYYAFSQGVQTAGYKVTRTTKGNASVVGAPNWSSISEIRVITTSAATGASAVSLDGIRLEDKDTYVKDNILVAREVLATPFIKSETMPQDVEFSLAVTIA